MRTSLLLVVMCFGPVSMTPCPLFAQVYGGTNAAGTLVLSNFVSAEATELIVALPATAKLGPKPLDLQRTEALPIPSAFKDMLEDIARQYQLDPNLLHAVIKIESGYNPQAVSPKGARGLMQLMPDTARRFGAKDSFNPRENVQAGAQYLKWLLRLFDGDVQLALAGYNAGERAVIRAGYRIPPYIETNNYVLKVLQHYKLATGS
jgi:soluble lytic murein transglycosylase-like protein